MFPLALPQCALALFSNCCAKTTYPVSLTLKAQPATDSCQGQFKTRRDHGPCCECGCVTGVSDEDPKCGPKR